MKIAGLLMVVVWAAGILVWLSRAGRIVLVPAPVDFWSVPRLTIRPVPEMLALFCRSNVVPAAIVIVPESMSVRVFGNTAIATGVFRAKGVEGGKAYSRRERFVDTWVYKGGQWRCVGTNATPILR